MKMVSLFILLFSATLFANSAPFYIDKDGERFYCTPTVTDPDGILDCIQKAYSGPFSKSESEDLCAGAHSEAPAECAIAAYKGPFSKTDSLTLCKGATSISPTECALAAYRGPFSSSESLDLCKNNGTLATVECAKKLYSGPYSKEESIRLCKNAVTENNFTEAITTSVFSNELKTLSPQKRKEQFFLRQLKQIEQSHLKQIKLLELQTK